MTRFLGQSRAEIKMHKAQGISWLRHFPSRYLEFCMHVCRRSTRAGGTAGQLSLSRLNHWPPWGQAHPEVVQGTAQFHHQITDAFFPQADAVFHDTAAFDTAVDMLNP